MDIEIRTGKATRKVKAAALTEALRTNRAHCPVDDSHQIERGSTDISAYCHNCGEPISFQRLKIVDPVSFLSIMVKEFSDDVELKVLHDLIGTGTVHAVHTHNGQRLVAVGAKQQITFVPI